MLTESQHLDIKQLEHVRPEETCGRILIQEHFMSVTDRDFNPSGSDAVAAIKQAAIDFELVIKRNSPASRRQSVALTNLETASMWAVKAAVCGDE